MPINFDITIKSKKWLNFNNDLNSAKKDIKEICTDIIALCPIQKLKPKKNNIEISLILMSNLQIKKINNKYRQKDYPTNTLSFPIFDKIELEALNFNSKLSDIFLGDLLFSYEKIAQESKLQNKNFKNHLTHLILHSILHILGFDHDNDLNAKEMENLEIKILKKLKIPNPYIN
ncbi:MAG: rRNA maturation RNase YbeY [Rickettsiales bacterium]|nr:rRNA maturation RNase YbeY [Rickettsiales bacterium]|tara:strand:+ start:11115 stop:11636 length:522 start_codon:yes stop_codon:yes gene_type:complete